MINSSLSAAYFDFLTVFDMFMEHENITLLLLGDYVDRGYFACELLIHLLSMKINYPHRVYLLRGNHECHSMAERFSFHAECFTFPEFIRTQFLFTPRLLQVH